MRGEVMRKLPPLGALRVFEAAARRLSFKDAAEELNVSATAVSHQIRQLEEMLNVKLFERATRQVHLTAAGKTLFPVLREGLDRFEQAIADVHRQQAGQVARLTSTVAFVAKRLAPLAGSFREMYPDWTLRLDASNRAVDLEADADAAIRFGGGNYPGLVTEPLFADRFAPVCAPSLAQTSAADLRLGTLIHFDWGPARRDDPRAPVWRQWLARAGVEDIDASAGISFTDEIHAVQAVVAGQGIGLLSLTLVAEELASGILVQPFELSLEGDRYDLVYSPRMADRPATRVLRDWVMAQFGGTVHQLGPRPASQPRA
ncbi:LysR substrate-binding domain-containing protein [Sinorhizobium meliloti]|uniref:LysR substrate-binding domain-containing protein n=1 Tax=Rhizobium meliloti TaxID=382 RepID=UPI0018657D70|nr:LysR substrate-binding domain-containing protein [Sinorhizobium meliloti]MDE3858138.1 LysR family transcriptional regulator [Sinorhizobium meliloti]